MPRVGTGFNGCSRERTRGSRIDINMRLDVVWVACVVVDGNGARGRAVCGRRRAILLGRSCCGCRADELVLLQEMDLLEARNGVVDDEEEGDDKDDEDQANAERVDGDEDHLHHVDEACDESDDEVHQVEDNVDVAAVLLDLCQHAAAHHGRHDLGNREDDDGEHCADNGHDVEHHHHVRLLRCLLVHRSSGGGCRLVAWSVLRRRKVQLLLLARRLVELHLLHVLVHVCVVKAHRAR
mmetsp:Transcript_20180/g.77261  ORF Transcript_20180/g.77261 Transcript_20180/m.77261 type:complete len:238 (+) Transcript_20180:24-737(+)